MIKDVLFITKEIYMFIEVLAYIINPREFDVDSSYGFSIYFGALEGLKVIL